MSKFIFCKKTSIGTVIFCLCLFFQTAHSQVKPPAATAQRPPEKFKQGYFGISPLVLEKDKLELNLSNSLASFWLASRAYDPASGGASGRVSNRYRYSRLDNLLRVSYGFSKSARWDLGAEFRYSQLRLDDHARTSPLRVFSSDTATGKTYRGLSAIGARIRAVPFENIPELTAQLYYSFPIARTPELKKGLSNDRSQLGLGLNYYNALNRRTHYFLQGDWNSVFKSPDNKSTSQIASASAFLVSSTSGQRWHFFTGMTFGYVFQSKLSNSRLFLASKQTLLGAGIAWQASPELNFFGFFQRPLLLESGNPYIEWVRESYSALSVGVRYWRQN